MGNVLLRDVDPNLAQTHESTSQCAKQRPTKGSYGTARS